MPEVQKSGQSEQLEHLMTVSTGVIDAYIVPVHNDVPMLLPQNIVLSALDSEVDVKHIFWHNTELPVYSVANPFTEMGVALVLEGEQAWQRFALLCDELPKEVRLRISELVDSTIPNESFVCYQYVVIGEQLYQVPRLDYIQKIAYQRLKGVAEGEKPLPEHRDDD